MRDLLCVFSTYIIKKKCVLIINYWQHIQIFHLYLHYNLGPEIQNEGIFIILNTGNLYTCLNN